MYERVESKGNLPDKKIGILLLCLSALSVWCIVSGILGLGKAGNPLDDIFVDEASAGSRYEGSVRVASPCFLQIAHSINLIPAGNEYYYLIFQDEDFSRAYVIRAGKHWEDYFDNGIPVNNVVISGTVKKMPSDAIERLEEVIGGLSEDGYEVYADRMYYLDTQSRKLYIMRILIGPCILYTVWMLYCICFKGAFSWKTSTGKALQSAGIAAMIFALVCGIYLSIMK